MSIIIYKRISKYKKETNKNKSKKLVDNNLYEKSIYMKKKTIFFFINRFVVVDVVALNNYINIYYMSH